jgi:hypothetical protein
MTRACGDCQLCCKIVPVKEIGKPANQRCPHQKFKVGCSVYSKRPHSCRMWACAWLVFYPAPALRRPDRAHYVIDMLPDYVRLVDDDAGKVIEIPVWQIWLEAGHPDAHRDPALRAFLDAEYKRTGMAALVRDPGNNDALFLMPPSGAGDGEWHEMRSNFKPEMQHTRSDIDRVLHDSGIKVTAVMEQEA